MFAYVYVCAMGGGDGGGGWGGDSIRQSHTLLRSPGDYCQPVILPCTPPSSLLLTAEIGQPHIMEGQ